jgi:hypothetical protein
MQESGQREKDQDDRAGKTATRAAALRVAVPIPNYTLSTVCPSCGTPTYRHACKVRCGRCGFMWDCSEL